MEQLWRGFILCVGLLIGTFLLSSVFSVEREDGRREYHKERLLSERKDEDDDT